MYVHYWSRKSIKDVNQALLTTKKFFGWAVHNKKRQEKRRTETLLVTQLNSGNEVRHQIHCKWYHYPGWSDGLLQLPSSCCGIRLTVLRAAFLPRWPLPATGAPVTPWVHGGFSPQSWCRSHEQDCWGVNCAATWDDRTCHSIRQHRDRQAPAHNPPCVANHELVGSSISVSSFVKINQQWQGDKRTLYQWLECWVWTCWWIRYGSQVKHNFMLSLRKMNLFCLVKIVAHIRKQDWNNETFRLVAV